MITLIGSIILFGLSVVLVIGLGTIGLPVVVVCAPLILDIVVLVLIIRAILGVSNKKNNNK